jgi:hypothetical protein
VRRARVDNSLALVDWLFPPPPAMVNTVPPGLIVTCRPAAPWFARIVTVTVWPAASVPEDGSKDMWPWPADTVVDQSTVPPCAVRVICVLPGTG